MGYQAKLISGIKRLRAEFNLTQDKFAEKVGLTLDGIRNIEQGRSTPTAKTIDFICSAFNIRPVDLFLDSPTVKKEELKQLVLDKINLSDVNDLKMLNDLLDFIRKNFKNDK